MSTSRDGKTRPRQPDQTTPSPEVNPRRPNDTAAALDDVVGSAADQVERALDADGVPKQCVTPRDILRSRYPLDTIDDEAITEEMCDAPFATKPPPRADAARVNSGRMDDAGPASRRARSLATPMPPYERSRTISSLSPIAVGLRPSRAPAAPPSSTSSIPPRPGPYARRAARATPAARKQARTFFSRAPSAAWILALITLGGVTAFTAVMASRSPGFMSPAAPPSRAAAAGPRTPLADAGAATVADAAATAASASPSARPAGTTTRTRH